MPRVGVLSLQGDVREHLRALRLAGAETLGVKTPGQLDEIDALVIPGGESTTIGKLAARFGLLEPIRTATEDGMPVFGTCAGMIFLASAITEGSQPLLGNLDVVVQRNAFGRQNESFEADLEVVGFDRPYHAVFIRAPWVEKLGAGVEVMAEVDGHPVLIRQEKILASSFHPELTEDSRIHHMFLDLID
ncbi:MAG: pyridoxal 5'-phosphate synthase glutaminase subunit PdxT [Acidimicrobiia bacterium]